MPRDVSRKILLASDRAYRLLLLLYPAEHRREYGSMMAQMFRDLCLDRYHKEGVWGLAKLWIQILLDTTSTVPVEHLDVRRQGLRHSRGEIASMRAILIDEGEKLTRREVLNYAWLASLGILSLDIAGISFLFGMPRLKEGEFGGIFTLGPASELPLVGTPPVNYPRGKFWLTRTEGGVLALYKVCTHLGCLYTWLDAEDKFRCPCHGSEFQYDGTLIRTPAPRSLDRFVIQILAPDGQVLAETDPETGAPLPVPDVSGLTVTVDTGRRVLGR